MGFFVPRSVWTWRPLQPLFGFDAVPHTPSAHFSLMVFLGAVYWKMYWAPEVFNT